MNEARRKRRKRKLVKEIQKYLKVQKLKLDDNELKNLFGDLIGANRSNG